MSTKLFNEKCIVSVGIFTQGTPDKGGKGEMPVFLRPLSGKIPRTALVLSGTVAKNEGLTPGKSYFIQVTEREERHEEYGRQWRHVKISEATPMDVLQLEDVLGKPQVVVFSDEPARDSVPQNPVFGSIQQSTM